MNVAKMTGSEKQINWAENIITAPYNRLNALANTEDRLAKADGKETTEKATLIRKAMEEYESQYNSVADQLSKASTVIDIRARFAGMAKAIVKDIMQDAGRPEWTLDIIINL